QLPVDVEQASQWQINLDTARHQCHGLLRLAADLALDPRRLCACQLLDDRCLLLEHRRVLTRGQDDLDAAGRVDRRLAPGIADARDDLLDQREVGLRLGSMLGLGRTAQNRPRRYDERLGWPLVLGRPGPEVLPDLFGDEWHEGM